MDSTEAKINDMDLEQEYFRILGRYYYPEKTFDQLYGNQLGFIWKQWNLIILKEMDNGLGPRLFKKKYLLRMKLTKLDPKAGSTR